MAIELCQSGGGAGWEVVLRPGRLGEAHRHAAGGDCGTRRHGIRDPIDAYEGDGASLSRRAERAERFFSSHHGGANFRRRAVVSSGEDSGARRSAVLHARDDLLANITALIEVNTHELVHGSL